MSDLHATLTAIEQQGYDIVDMLHLIKICQVSMDRVWADSAGERIARGAGDTDSLRDWLAERIEPELLEMIATPPLAAAKGEIE